MVDDSRLALWPMPGCVTAEFKENLDDDVLGHESDSAITVVPL